MLTFIIHFYSYSTKWATRIQVICVLKVDAFGLRNYCICKGLYNIVCLMFNIVFNIVVVTRRNGKKH